MPSMRACIVALSYIFVQTLCVATAKPKRPNILIILADDLGYGDLGWAPFTGDSMAKVKTPNLKAMSERGMILTNFHSASPICSPARASIMVGLFPWRLGVDFIYAVDYGNSIGDLKKDFSEEIDHEQLPLIPNIAMSFHDAGYYTAHIGKWHLGGQSHNDIPRRYSASNSTSRAKSCWNPGILQYGYDEYVGMSEGTGSARYRTHQAGNTYSTGSKYLVRNDAPIPPSSQSEILTDRQTDEAMRVIAEQTHKNASFFVNLWYDAPHSPWEEISPYYQEYQGLFSTNLLQKYASMISNMDYNIGRILKLLDTLGISEDTIVIFTSDNGPEGGAGSTGNFLGMKRFLTEGGIRVPAIVQWKGRVAAGTRSDKFLMTTDLFPTLLHAARLRLPPHIRIDGVSFLPVLEGKATKLKGDERLVLWYTHCPGYSKFTAAWAHGYKLIWNDYEGRKGARLPPAFRLFNMRNDPTERQDLLPALINPSNCKAAIAQSKPQLWADVNTASSDATLTGLAQHLQIAAHAFRYLGDYDWRITHNNQPAVSFPTCNVRTSVADTLTWHHSFLLPSFCGDSIASESSSRKSLDVVHPGQSCACAGHLCSNLWFKSTSWLGGAIGPSIDSFVGSNQRGKHIGMAEYVSAVFNASLFRPVCSEAVAENPAPDPSNVKALNILNIRSERICIDGQDKLTKLNLPNKKQEGEGRRYPWALGEWRRSGERQCHQRVHSRVKAVYLSGTGTGCVSSPVTIINLKHMPAPLSLCADSFARYTDTGHMDDNVFLVALQLLVRLNLSSDASFAELISNEQLHADLHSGKTDVDDVSRIALLDPLANHFWAKGPFTDPSNELLAMYREPTHDSSSINNRPVHAGFYRHIYSRLPRHIGHRNETLPQVDVILSPTLSEDGEWSLTAVLQLSQLQPVHARIMPHGGDIDLWHRHLLTAFKLPRADNDKLAIHAHASEDSGLFVLCAAAEMLALYRASRDGKIAAVEVKKRFEAVDTTDLSKTRKRLKLLLEHLGRSQRAHERAFYHTLAKNKF